MAGSLNPVRATPEMHQLLDELHRASEAQEASIRPGHAKFTSEDVKAMPGGAKASSKSTDLQALMKDKFIALDQDKAQFMYQLLRSTGATTVVEAGTSYGVSTIYLALAVAQNKAASGRQGRVIATEHEPEKAAKAKEYWAQCGKEVEDQIDLRIGDLLETLKSNVAEVDFLLLDIWTPLALPTLKLVQPQFRPGAVVLTDNTTSSSAEGYAELFAYLHHEESGFINSTLPFSGGLEMSVYLPKA